MNKSRSGFTIVELLIVIVVIGILAAITIVAYSGVQARAKHAQLSSSAKTSEKVVRMTLSATGEFPYANELYVNSDNYSGSTCLGSPSDYVATDEWRDGVCTAWGTADGPDQSGWRAKYNADIANQLKSQINTIPNSSYDTVRYNCSVLSCSNTSYEYSRGVSYMTVCSTAVTPSRCSAYIIYSQYGDVDCNEGVKRTNYDNARKVSTCEIKIDR